MEAIIFVGIQASGKSSFYKEKFSDTHIRVNLDMLHTRRKEDMFLAVCMAAKIPFVIDNTNVTAESRNAYIYAAKAAKFKVIGYYFNADVKQCLEIDSKRKKPVGTKGICSTVKKMEIPSYAEGFDQIHVVDVVSVDDDRFFVYSNNSMVETQNL